MLQQITNRRKRYSFRLAIQYLSIMNSDGALRVQLRCFLDMEQIVVLRFRTVLGVLAPTLWSVIGSPFTGKYRDASVIHDYYCDIRARPWPSVHRVFYDAMIVSGVSVSRAKLMYAAVYFAGPRWSEATEHNNNLNNHR
jgi:Protein of unknown function (DUF1353)